jgi:hypothetical protein
LRDFLIAYDHPTLREVLIERYGNADKANIVVKSGCLDDRGMFGEMRSGACRGCVPTGYSRSWWGLVEAGWLLIRIDFVGGNYEVSVSNINVANIGCHPMAIWEEISKKIKYRLEKMSELYSGLQAINHTLMIEDGLLFPDVP